MKVLLLATALSTSVLATEVYQHVRTFEKVGDNTLKDFYGEVYEDVEVPDSCPDSFKGVLQYTLEDEGTHYNHEVEIVEFLCGEEL